MGDNGMNMGHHGVWGKGNGTFPLNMFDTLVKVPAIFNHPGVIAAGQTCDALASQYDVLPTLLDYVGMDNPVAEGLPGVSFANLLRGGEGGGREDIVIYDEYGPVRMIRTREWKYVHRYPYGPHELFNLKDDPNEDHNLIDDPSCADVKVSLLSRLGEWFGRYVHPDKDSVYAPVTGLGQIGAVGFGNREGDNFYGGKRRNCS
jgi:arylsulfatase A-like enzyme